MNRLRFVCAFCCVFAAVFLFSCVSALRPPRAVQTPSRLIAGYGIKSESQLAAFFLAHNPGENPYRVKRMAAYYIEEAKKEGVNSDVAFVQMCLETGFLKFGGLVTPEMHNYCGLGAIDSERRGERFESEQMGVRAHIQHLQAYALTTPLQGGLIDPRYKYVLPRGKAQDVFALAGTWASDKAYGQKLDALLEKLGRY
jgi:hypothetical protein